MKILKIIILTILPMYVALAQTDLVDLKLTPTCTNDSDSKFQIDLLIKAIHSNSAIRVAEQNYRFIFNTNALQNPRISEEGSAFNGLVIEDVQVSAYSVHNLEGTLGNTISYNVELEGGVGTLLQENQWTKVGTIEFDVIDANASKEFTWLGLDQFPPTVVYNLVGTEKELLQPNFLYSTQPTQNVDLVQAVTRSWQHPCTENGGWIRLTWENVTEYENMFVSINGGASFTTVPNIDEEFYVDNLSEGDYDILVQMGEGGCPTRLDDINLKDLDYQTTYSTAFNCETGTAALQFNWVDNPFSTQIRISLDGGSTYTSVNDGLETYTFENVALGNYDVVIKMSNGLCTVPLGQIAVDNIDQVVSRSWQHPTCGMQNGSIQLSWIDEPTVETIQLSMDGGQTYTSIPDVNEAYVIENLSGGDYDIWVKWGANEAACAIQLDDVNLRTAQPAKDGLSAYFFCSTKKLRLKELDYDAQIHQFRYRTYNGASWSAWANSSTTTNGIKDITGLPADANKVQYRVRIKCGGYWSGWSPIKVYAFPACKLSGEQLSNEVSVYPNPFSNTLFIDFESDIEASAQLQITDLIGKTIYEESVQFVAGRNSHQIELNSNLSKGIYMVSIRVGEQPVRTVKMIKD